MFLPKFTPGGNLQTGLQNTIQCCNCLQTVFFLYFLNVYFWIKYNNRNSIYSSRVSGIKTDQKLPKILLKSKCILIDIQKGLLVCVRSCIFLTIWLNICFHFRNEVKRIANGLVPSNKKRRGKMKEKGDTLIVSLTFPIVIFCTDFQVHPPRAGIGFPRKFVYPPVEDTNFQ